MDYEIPIVWGKEQPAPKSANTILVEGTPFEEIILTLGHSSTMAHGEPEKQRKHIEHLQRKGLLVETVARVSMTIPVAKTLLNSLNSEIRK